MTDHSAVQSDTDAGYRLAMFPLSTVLYPGSPLSLHVFEPRYRELVRHCVAGTGTGFQADSKCGCETGTRGWAGL